MQIPDLYELPPDTVIESITGTLVSCYERKSGSNNKGGKNIPWSLQNASLKDSNGNTIPVQFKDCDQDFGSWKGKIITFRSQDRGHGLRGVAVIDDNYNNNVTRKLQIKSQVAISGAGTRQPDEPQRPPQGNSRMHQQEEPPRTEQRPATGPKPPTEPYTAPKKPGLAEQWAGVQGLACQIAHLHLIAIDTVENYMEPVYTERSGRQMDPEQKRSIATSMVIEMSRQGAFKVLPATRKFMPKPKPAANPQPPPPRHEPDPDESRTQYHDQLPPDEADDIPF